MWRDTVRPGRDTISAKCPSAENTLVGTLQSDKGDGNGNVRSLGRARLHRVGVPAKIEIANFTSEIVKDGHSLSCLSNESFLKTMLKFCDTILLAHTFCLIYAEECVLLNLQRNCSLFWLRKKLKNKLVRKLSESKWSTITIKTKQRKFKSNLSPFSLWSFTKHSTFS